MCNKTVLKFLEADFLINITIFLLASTIFFIRTLNVILHFLNNFPFTIILYYQLCVSIKKTITLFMVYPWVV